jgi:AcrR family transcriptional regulator
MSNHVASATDELYYAVVPKLWTATVETHRHEVRDAVLEATAALVNQRGLRAVTMSEIAETVGIGRATLYKYFPDLEAILSAWHERKVAEHIDQLARVRDREGRPERRLQAVLEAYAVIRQETAAHQDTELSMALHRGHHALRAPQRLRDMLKELITLGVKAGEIRRDVPAEELARYCVHALGAARSLTSRSAIERLVMVTLAGLRPIG